MLDSYLIFIAINTATFALFSLGLNLQWGLTGLVNFGHVAFMTLGAYTTVLISQTGIPAWGIGPLPWGWAMLLGMGVAAGLGVVIGAVTLRLRQDYLGIVTIGAAELVRLVALNEQWLTQGPLGLYNYPLPLARFGVMGWQQWILVGAWTLAVASGWWTIQRAWRAPLLRRRWFLAGTAVLLLLVYGAGLSGLLRGEYKSRLLVVLGIALALTFFLLEQLAQSPWGRVLKAIREDEEVAVALGKSVVRYKLQSLVLGGAIGGLAGAFYSWQLTFINPEAFISLITFQAWIIVMLGGAGNNVGTLLGALIFWLYDSLTRFALPAVIPLDGGRLGALRVMIIGLMLMALMIWRPQGLLGKQEELSLGR